MLCPDQTRYNTASRFGNFYQKTNIVVKLADKCKDWNQNRPPTQYGNRYGGYRGGGFNRFDPRAKDFARFGITPFNYFTEATKITLSFDSKDLNFWCPQNPLGTVNFRGNRYVGGNLIKSEIKYAPVQAVEAVESYCRFKLDAKKSEIEAKFSAAQKAAAQQAAQQAAARPPQRHAAPPPQQAPPRPVGVVRPPQRPFNMRR